MNSLSVVLFNNSSLSGQRKTGILGEAYSTARASGRAVGLAPIQLSRGSKLGSGEAMQAWAGGRKG